MKAFEMCINREVVVNDLSLYDLSAIRQAIEEGLSHLGQGELYFSVALCNNNLFEIMEEKV